MYFYFQPSFYILIGRYFHTNFLSFGFSFDWDSFLILHVICITREKKSEKHFKTMLKTSFQLVLISSQFMVDLCKNMRQFADMVCQDDEVGKITRIFWRVVYTRRTSTYILNCLYVKYIPKGYNKKNYFACFEWEVFGGDIVFILKHKISRL